ncbi:Rho GTPase-activating protein [Trichinella spiralis]|uniref:Rho GTPase-activating protein n=1 Tax=Trichinella spiralis TaxID=6334 RepID=A0A0V1BAG2_TRISP|nr:Rho GTPase-activating protein [Trichinella spiralis]
MMMLRQRLCCRSIDRVSASAVCGRLQETKFHKYKHFPTLNCTLFVRSFVQSPIRKFSRLKIDAFPRLEASLNNELSKPPPPPPQPRIRWRASVAPTSLGHFFCQLSMVPLKRNAIPVVLVDQGNTGCVVTGQHNRSYEQVQVAAAAAAAAGGGGGGTLLTGNARTLRSDDWMSSGASEQEERLLAASRRLPAGRSMQKKVAPLGSNVSLPCSTATASGSLQGNSSNSSGTNVNGGRLFTVAVVGLSGSEREKGVAGVGKSCLCNRFVRPLEDDYCAEHISALSPVDFGGRVVNNDHWLYWGERSMLVESGAELAFRIVEQTEFVDDEAFQPLRGSASQREPYPKRSTALKLHSPDKLMYICKDQLGVEHDYEQRTLPEGRTNVDGFVCVFDVSSVAGRSAERQCEFVLAVLQNALKTKKPVVLATTKHDRADERSLKALDRLLGRRELRSLAPLVETSAHLGVNVEVPFLVLICLADRSRARPRLTQFNDAVRRRQEIIDVATAAYLQAIRKTVPNHRWTWSHLCQVLSNEPDFEHFCDLCGRVKAKSIFEQYIAEMYSFYEQQRRQSELRKLPDALLKLLPDSSACCGKSWDDIVCYMQNQPYYGEIFRLDSNADDIGDRLSPDILYTPEAEACFRQHFAYLEARSARKKLLNDFSQLLANCSQVTPGKPLSDVRLFLMGKEPFESLPEVDLQAVYDQYQRVLIKRARQDFIELLLEKVDVFVSVLYSRRAVSLLRLNESLTETGPEMSDSDCRFVHERLQEDHRYRVMNRLYQWRDSAIQKYAMFIHRPSCQHCPLKPRCMDTLARQWLAVKLTSQSSTAEFAIPYYNIFYPIVNDQVKLLIAGRDPLIYQIQREFQVYLSEGLFDCHGSTLSVEFQCVAECDFSRFFSIVNETEANGVIVPYSCKASFAVMRHFILHTLLDIDLLGSDTAAPNLSYRLPAVVVFAGDPAHLDDMPLLQQQGARFCEPLQVQFIGLQHHHHQQQQQQQQQRDFTGCVGQNQECRRHLGGLLTGQQMYRCLSSLVCVAGEQYPGRGSTASTSSTRSPGGQRMANFFVCMMCGDNYDPATVLNPLLYSHNCCRLEAPTRSQADCSFSTSLWSLCLNGSGSGPLAEAGAVRVRVEAFLPNTSGRLLATATVGSYHQALQATLRRQFFDGYVLVYSAKRRASLAHLLCLSQRLPHSIPLMLVAVGEVVDFFSDQQTNSFIVEGSRLADELGARFITVSRTNEQAPSAYMSFYEDIWLRKSDTRNTHEYSRSYVMNITSPIPYASSETSTTSRQSFDQRTANVEQQQQQAKAVEVEEQLLETKEPDYMSLSSFWSGIPSDAALTNGLQQQQQQQSAFASSNSTSPYSERFQNSCPSNQRHLNSLAGLYGGGRIQAVASTVDSQELSSRRPLASPSTSSFDSLNESGCSFNPSLSSSSGRRNVAITRPSAPLATPESVEISADSLLTKSLHGDGDEISTDGQSLSSIRAVELDEGGKRMINGEQAPPARPVAPTNRRISVVGPTIAERVRQLASALDNSTLTDATRSLPGTPTLLGQRERTECTKSPFFFKTFMIPFRSSSEEFLLTEPTDFVYVRGDDTCLTANSQTQTEQATLSPQAPPPAVALVSPSFLARKVASSFRIRRKKPPLDESKSLPQSPSAVDQTTTFLLPNHHQLTVASALSKPHTTTVSPVSREKRLSGDVSTAGALVSAASSLVSSKLLAACSVQGRASLMKSPGQERSTIKERKLSKDAQKLRSSERAGSDPRHLINKNRPQSPLTAVNRAVCSDRSGIVCESQENNGVPLFVQKCVEFIEAEGLSSEGVYRVPGNQSQAAAVEQRFLENSDLSFKDLDVPVNVITTALKNYFAYQSEPLISTALYEPLIEAMALTDENERIGALRHILRKLTPKNHALLSYFLTHLRRIADHSEENAMDHRNLAKCLWPTLVRPQFDCFEKMAMMTQTLEDLVLFRTDLDTELCD